MLKSIVVTGATSMIGKALIEVAIREGTSVYAIVRKNTQRIDRLQKSPLIHILYAELDELSTLENIPKDCEVFYHFAWAGTARSDRNDPLLQEKNIKYTLDAVSLASRMHCHRFIGAGSQAEFGPVDGLIDETTRHAPVTAYGIAKYAAAILTQKRCEQLGLEHAWTRIFSVYGPEDTDGSMLSIAIDDFLAGRTAHFSAATQMWNYLYETDAGELFYRLGMVEGSGDWLIAGKESKPLKEYIREMMDVFGPEAKGDFAPPTEKPLLGLNVNPERTFRELGFVPLVSFREGIARTIEARKRIRGK